MSLLNKFASLIAQSATSSNTALMAIHNKFIVYGMDDSKVTTHILFVVHFLYNRSDNPPL